MGLALHLGGVHGQQPSAARPATRAARLTVNTVITHGLFMLFKRKIHYYMGMDSLYVFYLSFLVNQSPLVD